MSYQLRELVLLLTFILVKIQHYHVTISVWKSAVFVEKMAFASIHILISLLHAGTCYFNHFVAKALCRCVEYCYVSN